MHSWIITFGCCEENSLILLHKFHCQSDSIISTEAVVDTQGVWSYRTQVITASHWFFKNIGPSKVLMNDLLLLIYWRRILSLLFIETLGEKELKLLFHDGMINTSCIGKILFCTRHKLLAFNAWHTSIILLLTAYCAGNLFPTWCCKSKATAKV